MKTIAGHQGSLYHPAAISNAMEMERQGYIQVPHTDLDDKEDVILLHGGNGTTAPARYHRQGLTADKHGRRGEHVFEIYPDSQYSDTLPYSKTLLEKQSQEGEPFSRIGIFRLTQPEHAEHGKAMYAARDSLHRAGSIRE